jgi:hypothetical protein
MLSGERGDWTAPIPDGWYGDTYTGLAAKVQQAGAGDSDYLRIMTILRNMARVADAIVFRFEPEQRSMSIIEIRTTPPGRPSPRPAATDAELWQYFISRGNADGEFKTASVRSFDNATHVGKSPAAYAVIDFTDVNDQLHTREFLALWRKSRTTWMTLTTLQALHSDRRIGLQRLAASMRFSDE